MKRKLALPHSLDLIEYEIVYSRRRTMAIKIDPEGNVKVYAPQGTSDQAVGKMVESKAAWLCRNLAEIRSANAGAVSRHFTEGETFPFLGRDYPLQVKVKPAAQRITVTLEEDKFEVMTPVADEDIVRGAMEAWYRRSATEYINTRIHHFQSLLPVAPVRVTIRNQKTRWGSCSNRGSLNFNWRLMMAPAEVVDYVVVHELCHLLHPNHSKNFWNQVSAVLPDYRARQDWLKKNGVRLNF
ncbi:MAG TPA: SprT family zinc-dependent metalloprotease [Syntrophomonas sp.]|nr:SprT family zinc-dependent metalloprotease [Syntrophomonas sp.]HRW13463.1 SprT family zinc-dependent metalloprotease [Syntrophomonas sp.]